MMDFSFNQSMIAQISRSSPNTVSRTIASLNIPSLSTEASHLKRYSIENVRKINRHIYASSKLPIKQKINVFYNFKGGTGKTSICYQVATHLALLGFKVLALDLDPQAHLSLAMQLQEDYSGPTIYDVLINSFPLQEALVQVIPGLELLPANISMTKIEVPLSTKTKREEKLMQIIEPFRAQYDYIILDTNPTLSTLNMNALLASDRINIVCETQPFSLAGLHVLVQEIEAFYQDMKYPLNYCVIANKYEIKTATAQEVLGSIRTEYGDKVINAVIRKAEEINIAAKRKLPLTFFCKTKSAAFEDIMDLIHEFVLQTQNDFEGYSHVNRDVAAATLALVNK